jgi:hypothetical protein
LHSWESGQASWSVRPQHLTVAEHGGAAERRSRSRDRRIDERRVLAGELRVTDSEPRRDARPKALEDGGGLAREAREDGLSRLALEIERERVRPVSERLGNGIRIPLRELSLPKIPSAGPSRCQLIAMVKPAHFGPCEFRRNVRPPCDGDFGCLGMYFATVVCPISMPSFSSSPWIRGAPHNGFARLICRIKSRSSRGTPGRPALRRRDLHVQNSRKP